MNYTDVNTSSVAAPVSPNVAPMPRQNIYPWPKSTTYKKRQEKITKPPIYYPESDDLPMAENTIQYAYLTTIKGNLEISYKNDPDVFIAGDLFWYPVEGDPNIKYAPDVMIVFGRPKGDRGSYRQWEEEGIPPQVVFEIWSPGNRKQEKEKKFAFYNRYGVEEYYTYDPDSNTLEGWLRQDGSLQKITDIESWRSPRLGIRFAIEETADGPKLEIYDENERRFLSHVEESDAREAAETEAARVKAQLHAALEQLQKAGLPLPEIDG